MKNLVAVTGFLIVLTSSAAPLGPSSDTVKFAKVILPTIADGGLLQSVNPEDCLDMDIYADKFKLLAITDESDYLCAYIAFQSNKDDNVGVGFYSSKEEADYRYVCFKQSVDRVNSINSENLGWTAGINYFSDMTPFENSRYLGFGRLPNNMPNNCVDPVPDTKRRTFPKRISTSTAAPKTSTIEHHYYTTTIQHYMTYTTTKALAASADAEK